jgi:ABC-type nickel/cobalt efflux system permease component RcnA
MPSIADKLVDAIMMPVMLVAALVTLVVAWIVWRTLGWLSQRLYAVLGMDSSPLLESKRRASSQDASTVECALEDRTEQQGDHTHEDTSAKPRHTSKP